jgi:hypothetical protein
MGDVGTKPAKPQNQKFSQTRAAVVQILKWQRKSGVGQRFESSWYGVWDRLGHEVTGNLEGWEVESWCEW